MHLLTLRLPGRGEQLIPLMHGLLSHTNSSGPAPLRAAARLEFIARVCSLGPALIALVVLVGWMTGIQVLKSIEPSWVAMKVNTALGILLSGLSLYASHLVQKSKSRSLGTLGRGALVLAAAVMLIGLGTLAEDLWRINLGIDELLISDDKGALHTSAPGRMAFSTAICFTLLGLGILGSQIWPDKPRNVLIVVVLPVSIVSLLAVVGYICSNQGLYTLVHSTAMAMHTAIALGMLSISLLCLYKSHPVYSLMGDVGPGGHMTRLLLPAVLFLPLLTARIHLVGSSSEWFTVEQGEAVETSIIIFVFTLIVLAQGLFIHKADLQRLTAQALAHDSEIKLREANIELERRVALRTQELSELSERLEEVGRIARVGGWEMSLPSRTVTWSRMVAEIHETHCTTTTTLNDGLDFYLPEYRSVIAAAVEQACSLGIPYDLELRITTANNRQIWIRTIGRAYRCDGIITRIGGIFQDIDLQKRNQLELEQHRMELEELVVVRTTQLSTSRQQLIEAQAMAQLGSWEWDPVSDQVQGSIEFHRQFDLNQGRQIGMNDVLLRIPQERQDPFKAYLQNSLAGNEAGEFEVQLNPEQVEGRYLIIHTRVIHPEKSTGRRLLITSMDLTSKVLAQQREDALQQRFSIFMEHVPEAVFIHESGGSLVYSNKCFNELFVRPITQSSMSGDRNIAPETLKAEQELRGKLLSGPSCSEELLTTMSGERRFFDIRRFHLRQEGAAPLACGVAIDITQRRLFETHQKEIEARLRQQQKLEALGTMASGVAHEINNPINGILNYAQLILDAAPRASVQETYAGEIIWESKRVADIVRNLLQFSRQEKQLPTACAVQETLEETLLLIRSILKKDQILLEIKIAPDLPLLICSKQQIQQVLLNLITNSRDALNQFSPQGMSKRIELSSTLWENANTAMVRLSVTDNGGGIPPEVLPKIFDPFFTTKPLDKGTGLGLAISHGIMQELGGSLSVENVPSVGCTFHVNIPTEQFPPHSNTGFPQS